MVIDDLYVQRVSSDELEADSPSRIDCDGPLAAPITLQSVQADAVQDAQIAWHTRHIQRKQEVDRCLEIQSSKPVGPLALPDFAGGAVGPRPYHGKNVLRSAAEAKSTIA
jgi:hypothetical protein